MEDLNLRIHRREDLKSRVTAREPTPNLHNIVRKQNYKDSNKGY